MSIKEALKEMFTMSWTISLPGKIVKSNADVIQGGSATWCFDIDSFEQDRYTEVHTRYTNWPVIGGLLGVIFIALAGGLGMTFIRKRRAKIIVSTSDENDINFVEVDNKL